MSTAVVVTSIAGPIPILRSLAEGCATAGWTFHVAGDRKSPADFSLDHCSYLSLDAQKALPFRLPALTPENSYVRKNLAYLQAIADGATEIIDTDDDNLPLPDFWRERSRAVTGDLFAPGGWVNTYALFADTFSYPRGYPLDLARESTDIRHFTSLATTATCPIQQGLVDEAPDVDAIFRLFNADMPAFAQRAPVILPAGNWCPTNSQDTLTFREAFPLLYLPATCTFRATDIWRGLIAQRLLWTCGWSLSFHSPDVRQIRNPHSLMSDFNLEVPVYLHSGKFADTLAKLDLPSGPEYLCDNLLRCYQALIALDLFKETELDLVEAWIKDLSQAGWSPIPS